MDVEGVLSGVGRVGEGVLGGVEGVGWMLRFRRGGVWGRHGRSGEERMRAVGRPTYTDIIILWTQDAVKSFGIEISLCTAN